MDGYGWVAILALLLVFGMFMARDNECRAKGGRIVYATCIKADAIIK